MSSNTFLSSHETTEKSKKCSSNSGSQLALDSNENNIHLQKNFRTKELHYSRQKMVSGAR